MELQSRVKIVAVFLIIAVVIGAIWSLSKKKGR